MLYGVEQGKAHPRSPYPSRFALTAQGQRDAVTAAFTCGAATRRTA